MAIEKTVRFFLLMVLFNLGLFPLWTQNNGAYFSDTRYTQRLAWTSDPNVTRYEVVVEREDKGEYRRVLQQFTEVSYIEASLSPGKYRYHVIPYDILNRPSKESQWMNFEIRTALRPELHSFSPDFFIFDDGTEFVLNLSGKNLLRESEIYLRQLGTDNSPIVPTKIDINQNGNSARLHFNYEQLQLGFYVVFVKNPGGQETSRGELAIGYPETIVPEISASKIAAMADKNKLFALHIGALWMPMIHLYGGIDQLFSEKFSPISGAFRIGLFLNRPKLFFQPGLEMAASWYELKENADDYNAEMQVTAGDIYLAMLLGGDTMGLAFRAGIGSSYQTGIYTSHKNNQTDTVSMNGSAPHMDFGMTAFYTIYNRLSVELGLYYTHLLVKENASGYLRPSVGIGWHF